MSWWRNPIPSAHFADDKNTGKRVNWVKNTRAVSPLRGTPAQNEAATTEIITKMNAAGVRDADDVIKANLNAARAFLRSQDAHDRQSMADSSALSADKKAAYDNFYSADRDIIISNAIHNKSISPNGNIAYIGWKSPNPPYKDYNLEIKIPDKYRGGKSKRVKRSKTCKSKRVKRSKTCKNRVHKRRN